MEVRISIQSSDQGTAHIAEAVRAPFASVSERLCKDFGPGLDHLWVEVELSPVVADRKPPFPFRFQKRVNPRPGLLPKQVVESLKLGPSYNVGHYSLRPDYFELAKVPIEKVATYLLTLVYESTAVLEKRKGSFPRFRISEFRNAFHEVVITNGHES